MRRNSHGVGLARLCLYAVLAATAAVTLGGCSGGGGGGGAAATPTTTPTAAGLALQTAAAAAPATTNTAANPAQAFGLVATAGLPIVAVNSPPVVNFAVIDANGKHVPGLTLVKAAGAADPACSTSATSTAGNVTVAMAKFDGSNWQSLISRQRYATSTAGQNSVAEGSYDPKPTATYANPATVAMTVDTATGKATVTDQGNQIVGILTENAMDGYYTYAFAIDVVTPLLFANAVDKKNVSTGKVANNGNVAAKDGTTIHRLGLQLCYTDPASKVRVVVNPYLDFTLAADGTATPVTVSATDKTLKPYRQVVDTASCNDCHQKLTAHGTRVDANYCVICHNTGSKDYYTGNEIDFKLMIHKFHRGQNLLNDYQVSADAVAKTTSSTGEVTGFVYPQDIRNCVKCHDGRPSARHPTPDGYNWTSKPSRNACGACHDGIDFATGLGTTIKGATTGHNNGSAQPTDNNCANSGCHTAAYMPLWHALPQDADASQRTMSAAINKVEVGAADGKVTVTFTMTKSGVAVTGGTADFTLVKWTLAKLVTSGNLAPSRWQSYASRFRTKDAAKVPVIQGNGEAGTAGTLTNLGGGRYTYTFALLNADTAGDIRTITHAYNVSTVAGAYNSATVPTYPYAVTYDADATHRVALEFTEAVASADSTGASVKKNNHDNASFDFVPSGKTAATRNIIDMTTCRDGCHSGTKLHEGWNTNLCVTCHTETTYDPFSGDNPVTVDLKYIVHRIHMGADLPSVVQGGTYVINGTHDYSEVALPQSPSNCLACHLSAATAGYSEGANWKTAPSRLACGACHDGINFATGGGSTLKDISAWVSAKLSVPTATLASTGHGDGSPQTDDSLCADCHDAGRIVGYHIK